MSTGLAKSNLLGVPCLAVRRAARPAAVVAAAVEVEDVDGDLDGAIAEDDLDRDFCAVEVDLVPPAVRVANDCVGHGLSSLRHP